VTVAFETALPDASVSFPVNAPAPVVCPIRGGTDKKSNQAKTIVGVRLSRMRKTCRNILHLFAGRFHTRSAEILVA
jgi:hypothetical protein